MLCEQRQITCSFVSVWGGTCLCVHDTWPPFIAPSVVEAFTGSVFCQMADLMQSSYPAVSQLQLASEASKKFWKLFLFSRYFFFKRTVLVHGRNQKCIRPKGMSVPQWFFHVWKKIKYYFATHVLSCTCTIAVFEILYFIVYFSSWLEANQLDSASLKRQMSKL